MRTAVAPMIAAATATAAILAGCGGSGDGVGSAEVRPPTNTQSETTPAGPPTPPSSAPEPPPPPPPPPVTATVTVTAPPSSPAAVAPPPVAPPAPTPSTATDPVGVLNAYFAAVNARDYARAWALGGQVFAANYAQFVSDHVAKAHYDLTVLGVDGPVVTAAMDVTQTDGTHRYYQGTYSVRDGAVSGTTMRETTAGAPPNQVPGTTPSPPSGDAPLYFDDCSDAWDAGEAPMKRGEPGYRDGLDRDNDGTACEPSPGQNQTSSTPPPTGGP